MSKNEVWGTDDEIRAACIIWKIYRQVLELSLDNLWQLTSLFECVRRQIS